MYLLAEALKPLHKFRKGLRRENDKQQR